MTEFLKGKETVKPNSMGCTFGPYVKEYYIATSEIVRIEVLGNTARVCLRKADRYGMNQEIELDNDEDFQTSMKRIMDKPIIIINEGINK